MINKEDMQQVMESVAGWVKRFGDGRYLMLGATNLDANVIKATLKAYFDTLYVALTGDQSITGAKTFSTSVSTPIIQATSAAGVAIKDDGGNVGVFVADGGRVGIRTATPAVTETYDRLTIEDADTTSMALSIINTSTGQAAFQLRRTGGTVARWSHYIPAASTQYRMYSTQYAGDVAYYTDAGSFWVANNISGLSFTDRTKGYDGDALAELLKIETKGGEIDHATLPDFARMQTENGYERDLGAMISMLTVAVQQLATKMEALKKKP